MAESVIQNPNSNAIQFYAQNYLADGGTTTFTLIKECAYLLVIDRLNTDTQANNGLYFIQCHNNSNILPILSANTATVTINGATLTVTVSTKYTKVAVIQITR